MENVAERLTLSPLQSSITTARPDVARLKGESMTKADLVDKVTRLGALTRRDGAGIVETLFESIIGALKSGDKIEVRGFGSFRTRQRKSRTGRNPKTGDKVEVPAKRVPFFKPSKELRDAVNPTSAKPVGKKTLAEMQAIDPHHPPAM